MFQSILKASKTLAIDIDTKSRMKYFFRKRFFPIEPHDVSNNFFLVLIKLFLKGQKFN